jgi:hypothetical protein
VAWASTSGSGSSNGSSSSSGSVRVLRASISFHQILAG